VRGEKSSRIFSIYAGLTYLLFAFLQSIAVTEKYGLGCNHLQLSDVFLCCCIMVLGGSRRRERLFAPWETLSWELLGLAPGILRLLGADQPEDNGAGLNPVYILTSGAGLAFWHDDPGLPGCLALLLPAGEYGAFAGYRANRADYCAL